MKLSQNKCTKCGKMYLIGAENKCALCYYRSLDHCEESPKSKVSQSKVRTFDSGATRDSSEGKFDFEGFYTPTITNRFAEYMNKHRIQSDNSLRDSDNWQKGVPKDQYMKSAFRHFHDWWSQHRGLEGKDDFEESICALIFNAQGYLFELLKERKYMEKKIITDVTPETEG